MLLQVDPELQPGSAETGPQLGAPRLKMARQPGPTTGSNAESTQAPDVEGRD